MLIKKYNGSNIDEIQARIIAELGPAAVILFTTTVEKGFLDWLVSGTQYEVTVGVEPDEFERYLKENPILLKLNENKLPLEPLKEYGQQPLEILVSGPVKFIPQQKNIVFLLGSDEFGNVVAATKLFLQWNKETKLKVGVISFGALKPENSQQIESFIHVFNLSYNVVKDDNEFQDMIQKSDCEILVVIVSNSCENSIRSNIPNSTFLLILNGNNPVAEQLNDIQKYHRFSIFGLVFLQFEGRPSFLFLNELFEKQKVPISYIMENSEMKLANADDLDTRIINEKLANLTSWSTFDTCSR